MLDSVSRPNAITLRVTLRPFDLFALELEHQPFVFRLRPLLLGTREIGGRDAKRRRVARIQARIVQNPLKSANLGFEGGDAIRQRLQRVLLLE